MKKMLSILLAILFVISFGCSAKKSTPKNVVTYFSNALKAFDIETMKKHTVSWEDMDGEISQDLTTDKTWNQLTEWAKSIEYQIIDATEEGDTAKVTVKYKHIDASDIAKEVMQEYFLTALASAFSDTSETVSGNEYWDLLFKKAKSSTLGTTETTVIYDCIKADGVWKIKEIPKEAAHVLTGNAFKLFLDIADAFSDSETADTTPSVTETSMPTEQPVITTAPTAAPTSVPTATPIPRDPTIIYSPADEYDFRMELIDEHWTYTKPENKDEMYVINNTIDGAGAIYVKGEQLETPINIDILDQVVDIIADSFSDSPEALMLEEKEDYLVRNYQGRAAIGTATVNGYTYSIKVIAWGKDTQVYYAFALADAPFYDATVSELTVILMTFQTTGEYSRDGEAQLPYDFVRGGSYDVTYTNAVYWKNSIGTYWVQAIVLVTNPGTIPIYIDGGSIDIEDANGKLVKTMSYVSAYPDILLPGESTLIVKQATLDEKPATDALIAIDHLSVKKSKNPCIRYKISETEIKDSRYGGLKMMGRVFNNSSESAGYLYVVANLYDANHNPIGQLIDIVSDGLKSGEKKGFTATTLSAPPSLKKDSVAFYEVFAFPLQYQF